MCQLEQKFEFLTTICHLVTNRLIWICVYLKAHKTKHEPSLISLANENNQNIYSAVSDGLRDQSAEAARRLAAAPPAAVLEYAAALGAVFQDCRAAYGGMVEKADGHAGDVRAHREAWPVNPRRPDAGTSP